MSALQRNAVNDRERLATAFSELAQRGYLLLLPPWDVCCTRHGWAKIAEVSGVSPDSMPTTLRTVWWYEQVDTYAFMGDVDGRPHTRDFLARLPHKQDEAENWLATHTRETAADSVAARLNVYNNLVAPLFLHWFGDSDEIVAALRASGLRVVPPPDRSLCIEVLPAKVKFKADAIDGEVSLELDGDQILLTPEDARRLSRSIGSAARKAEVQAAPFTAWPSSAAS